MDNYSKSQELSRKFQECLKVYADMLGAPDPQKESMYGFVPGLQMTNDEKALEEQLDKLEQGIFQVLFTGCFSCGKSTMLNALMRKEVLRTAISAETAVITRIVFGQDEKVLIYEKAKDGQTGESVVREMNVEDFFNEFRVSQEHPEKFDNIDYVLMQQPGEGIGGTLVQMVDSPGTENSPEDTLAARKFAENASAIVHMINSVTPFVQDDKDYIEKHYAGRHMRNIFFVFNRFDSLNEQAQEELKARVPQQLHDVFSDENGKFDQELFESRVFYTDAYHSLKARTGEKIKTPYGLMACDDSVSGVPEFEQGLSGFLTADDRDKEAFRGYMTQLATKYVRANDKIDRILEDYRRGVDELIAQREDFEGKKEQLNNIIDQIQVSCRTCLSGILNSARSEYTSCINRINTGWDRHFEQVQIPFGIKEIMVLTIHKNNEAKVKETTKPFADAVKAYIKDEFSRMSNTLGADINAHLSQLEKQLSIQQKQMESLELPISFEDLKQALLESVGNGGKVNIDGNDTAKANLFQIILGIIGMDFDIIADGVNGGVSNTQAIVNFLVRNVLEYIALNAVAWPIGIGMIIYRIVSMIKGIQNKNNTRAADILKGIRKDTVSALEAQQDKYVLELENVLSAITQAGTKMTEGIHNQVKDYEANLNNTIEKLQVQENGLEEETLRTDKIRQCLLDSISGVNMLLDGKGLTDAEVREKALAC